MQVFFIILSTPIGYDLSGELIDRFCWYFVDDYVVDDCASDSQTIEQIINEHPTGGGIHFCCDVTFCHLTPRMKKTSSSFNKSCVFIGYSHCEHQGRLHTLQSLRLARGLSTTSWSPGCQTTGGPVHARSPMQWCAGMLVM